MSDDLIRRSDAIKAMEELSEHYTDEGREWHPHIDFVLDELRKIPTAEPKQGEWIGEGDGYADGGIVYDIWYCSNCDHCEEGEELALPNFCPNCGVKMKGASDAKRIKKAYRGRQIRKGVLLLGI